MFSTSTTPTIAAVRSWITTGCAVIDTHLAAAGYSTPIASTITLYGMLTRCNTLFAAARVEESRANITMAPDARTRGQVFEEQFKTCLEGVLKMDLTFAGATRTSTATIYVGGTSASNKQAWEEASGRVLPRFSRDQFKFPGTIDPRTTTAS